VYYSSVLICLLMMAMVVFEKIMADKGELSVFSKRLPQ